MRVRVRLTGAALAAAIAVCFDCAASVPTMNECLEASDFVANAARSRDNGVARNAFIERLEQDFVAIRAFPPALRWFVKDDDDERFLEAETLAVYDRPRSPEWHRAAFLKACLDRAITGSTDGSAQDESDPGTI